MGTACPCHSRTVAKQIQNSELKMCPTVISTLQAVPTCAGSSMPKTSGLSHIEVGDSTYSIGDTVLVKGEKKQQFVSLVCSVRRNCLLPPLSYASACLRLSEASDGHKNSLLASPKAMHCVHFFSS